MAIYQKPTAELVLERHQDRRICKVRRRQIMQNNNNETQIGGSAAISPPD